MNYLVSLITKVYLGLIGLGQAVFFYQVLTVFSHDVVYPLSILNYFIGYAILAVLIVDILVNLKGLSRYVSFLTVIPVLNVIVVGILAYKLSHSLWSSFLTSLIWFVNLILSLVLPVPAILAYGFDLPLIWYMVLQDIASLASLMILGILLLKYEKRKEETNLENREYRI